MGTISCHSNQSSYPTGIKNTTFVEGNVLIARMPCFSFILLTVSEKNNFEYFSKIYPLICPLQPIKLSNLDKSPMKHAGLLNKYFCKKNSNIPNDFAEIVNFNFSHYKSMGTISCHSNHSSYPTGIKNTTYVEANALSMYAKFRLHPLYGFW